ncbi:MAG: HisA/HisF-related TIM barrel protein, partial [Gammaproteobacteria bacterium]|nr:HisA/HisF-related TIM barrel protein [Gammaproteobacteria bacterium]
DGMMKGCNVKATIELANQVQIPVIASGGIAKLDDIVDLKSAAKTDAGSGIIGVITGRAIYEGALDLREAQKYCDVEDSIDDFG